MKLYTEDCSLDAFRFAATANADKNCDGIIDDSEKTIFDNYMKQFDIDKNGEIDDSDVKAFEKTVTFTEDEKTATKDLLSLLDKYGLSKDFKTREEYLEAFNKVPKEVVKQMDELSFKFAAGKEKRKKNCIWNGSIVNAFDYYAKLSDEARSNILQKFRSYINHQRLKFLTIDSQK